MANKKNRGQIKRVFVPLAVAAFVLLAGSQLPYTRSFRSNILGDEETVKEQEKHEEEQRKEEEKKQQESLKEVNIQSNETEVQTPGGVTVKTKREDSGVRKVEIESDDVKFKFEQQAGEVKLRAETKDGEEVESPEHEEEIEDLEAELEDEDIEIASQDGQMEIARNAVHARVAFPLSLDPATNTLIVDTPQGEKPVEILPDDAVFRLLSLGILSEVGSFDVPASGSGGIAQSIELTVKNGNLVYEVEGKKLHRLFGIIPVSTGRTVTVSAATGDVLSQTQTIFSSLIDLLSL